MGWRFRKSINLGKGVRLNLSKRGVGMSVGGKGFRVGVGSRGLYTSTSIPGTGLYKIDYLNKTKKKQKDNEPVEAVLASDEALSTPPELMTTSGKGCLWTFGSLVLLFWQPVLGIISIAFQLIGYFRNSKTPQRQALKHFNLGKLAYQKQDYQEALNNFLHVIEFMPNIKSLNQIISDLYLNLGDKQNAVNFLEKYLEDNPNDNLAKIKLVNILDDLKEYHKALKVLQSLPDDLRNEVSVINATAICFIKLDKFDLALDVLEKGPMRKRKMDEDLKLYRYLLGLCYRKVGNVPKAIKQFKKVYAEDISYLDVEEQLRELEGVELPRSN